MTPPTRIYSLEAFEGTLYAVTQDERVLLRTEDFNEARAFYAALEGIEPALVTGPTNSAEQELLLAEQLVAAAG